MAIRFLPLLPPLAAVLARAGDAPPSTMNKMFPGGLHDVFDLEHGGLNSVPTTDHSVARWSAGLVPRVCYDAATKDQRCAVDQLDVYDVTYADCEQPWTVCRCRDSTMAIESIAEHLGRLPVAVRTFVRFTQFYEGARSAFTDGSDITFNGNFSENHSVFVHESSHNLDRWVAGDAANWFSRTGDWTDFGPDTCIPDDYAGSTYTEDFAQIGVLVAYDANVQSVWNLDQADSSCLFTQFRKASRSLNGVWTYKKDAKCGDRINEDDSPPVCISDEAKQAGKCNSKSYENGAKLRTRADYAHIKVVRNSISPENQPAIDAMVDDMKAHSHLYSPLDARDDHDHRAQTTPTRKLTTKIAPENQPDIDAMLKEMKATAGPRSKRFVA